MPQIIRATRSLLPLTESFLAGFGVGALLAFLSHGLWHG